MILFNMGKLKINTEKTETILMHINTLLGGFSLSLRVIKRERIYGIKNLVSFYGLKHEHNIDEIIYHKMKRQNNINDIN